MTADNVIKELKKIANPTKAKFHQGYFKTYEGGYAEGDKFFGITVPLQRTVAKKYRDLELAEVSKLISSDIHEVRFTGLEILVSKYEKASEKGRSKIVAFYLKNRQGIDNWDLVDTSAPYVLGDWLLNKDRSVLYKLVKSKTVWDRRIAIVSTYAFIKNNEFADTLNLSEVLLKDKHDLIHKAVGWMLREVGKKSEITLEKFLKQNSPKMHRTTLRYSIEKLSKEKKTYWLSRGYNVS